MARLKSQAVRGKRVWKECDVHGVLVKNDLQKSNAENAKKKVKASQAGRKECHLDGSSFALEILIRHQRCLGQGRGRVRSRRDRSVVAMAKVHW